MTIEVVLQAIPRPSGHPQVRESVLRVDEVGEAQALRQRVQGQSRFGGDQKPPDSRQSYHATEHLGD